MIKWAGVGISAGILSQDTGYSLVTCKKEIKRVIEEGHTENTENGLVLKNVNDFKCSLFIFD